MKPAGRLWVGILLAVVPTAAVWLCWRTLFDDGIDRRMFINSPGTIYAGTSYIPLPRLENTPRTAAGSAAVMKLRGVSVSEATALLGEPNVRSGHQGAVLVWHSAISCEKPQGGGWPVAHVVAVIDQQKILAIAVVGSFGTVQVCDPPGSVGAGP